MPAWWGKKSSSKSKEDDNTQKKNPHGVDSSSSSKLIKLSYGKNKESPPSPSPRRRSVDDKDFFDTRGFSGFDSDSAEPRRGHPLPRPSLSSSMQNDQGSASVSASSLSSSGSSEDIINQIQTQFAARSRRSFAGPGSHSEISYYNSSSRSPVTGSRGPTSPTSPLHRRLSGISLESPTGKKEDLKSQSHRLPLPPGSPTSPSLSNSTSSGFSSETSFYTPSKWRKGRLLGRGTFGHVYLGFNSESGQMCAIKEVTVVSDDLTSKECLKQLNQEINLLSQLHHSNIVRYYGSELSGETLSVYLEYVSGGSIHKLLQEYGSFREPVIQNYTRQILSGLAYLHGRSTVHRDIKGANILVDPNGVIKLADFGMSKHITACSSMLSFKGSPYWMAPEVVMNTSGYSLAVDIWSLGCTILEMATSKPPWSQYEGVAAIFKIGNSKDIPEIPDHLSNDAKNFIRLCLQREPSLRPTATRLLEHPFVLNLATIRIMKDALPNSSDGSRSPHSEQPVSELHSNKSSLISVDGDFGTKPFAVTSKTCMSPTPRDCNAIAMTSLPASPCSSPLRYGGAADKSCFLSPPHPVYNMGGPSGGYNLNNDYSGYAATGAYSTRYCRDPLHEISSLRIPTPTPPRSRPPPL